MLVSLSIRNFVLIEDAVLEFGDGLTVLTGETGAGKTLLTKALGLLMGERAEEGLIGPAGEEACIEAVFDVDDALLSGVSEQIRDLISPQAGGSVEELIVTRRLSRGGRNRCYINGAAVTLNAMSVLLARLLSFAGQHEYRQLLDPAYQLRVLDEWSGPDSADLNDRYIRAFRHATETLRALDEAERSGEARLREIRLLRYEVDELTAAGLSTAEEEALAAEQRVLAHAEELLMGVGLVADLLSNERHEPDVNRLVAQASAQLARLTGVDDALDALAAGLVDVQYRLTELSRELHAHADHINADPERLEVVDGRLRLYADLARKYGGSTDAVLEHLEHSRGRLAVLERTEEDLQGLKDEWATCCAHALALAAELSQRREQAIPRLEEAVRAQLIDLGMPEASFRVSLRARSGWEGLRESGAETVELLLAANPGQPPRGLAAAASGGELSRVLLALKCALAGTGGDETLVFDEIDAGIGGRTAVAVAAKLRELSCRSQLIVVTHLATVAALADRHYLIEKTIRSATDASGVGVDGPTAATRLRLLKGADVVEELCRMMGGRPDDPEAMAHARRLWERGRTAIC